MTMFILDRRMLLRGTAGLGALSLAVPGGLFAQEVGNKRLFVIILRGAADGLSVAAPLGDPAYEAARGPWLETYADARKLDGFFVLHPALEKVGALYAKGEALVAHAVATDYRERSHFDAQNLLETGGTRAYGERDGWLNRLAGMLAPGGSALALAPTVPLILRGDAPVSSYAPSRLPDASELLTERIEDLYADDPQLAALWQQAQATRDMAGDLASANLRNAQQAGTLAASLMEGDSGARILTLDLNGWDSHANQVGQIARRLAQLDVLLGAFHESMGTLWPDTMVAVVTEFGRTVARNGTNGTDHGTGGAAFLLGGSVRGGRVMADWPGLAAAQLYEGRDLRPTMSLEVLLAGALAEHFALDPALAMRTLFPGRTARAGKGFMRT
ncbi:DUF1501 domain-containing protein [Qipengyuania qiaonensis]|uniref:DUF1501 domain-containing protein n=1 Tax=Qipengyuania qiaonensis TaxID=2867240 RepID=A0ABS7JBV9_9SPHN|nr:DUF1501 domain-containing protein [Qipengyuania qiaonensis]MBX7483811.1 DUF1501 domain-containing protein [Qipengyuania qiaonensis]